MKAQDAGKSTGEMVSSRRRGLEIAAAARLPKNGFAGGLKSAMEASRRPVRLPFDDTLAGRRCADLSCSRIARGDPAGP
jgi:hypothetical protein